MECIVRWIGNDVGMLFVVEIGSGYVVVMDGVLEVGG